MKRRSVGAFVVVGVIAATLTHGSDQQLVEAGGGVVELVSVGPAGEAANSSSRLMDVTADGARVLFTSNSSSFGPGSSFGQLWLRAGLTTQLVSHEPGNPSSAGSYPTGSAGISDNGRYVAFVSAARNLAATNDPPGDIADVFVRDLQATAAEQLFPVGVNPFSDPTTNIDVSDDGRYVVVDTPVAHDPADTNGIADVYRFDRTTGGFDWVSRNTSGVVSDGASSRPRMTPSGDQVVFTSDATNLVADDTNGKGDAFVWSAPRDFGFEPGPRPEPRLGYVVRASTDAVNQQLPNGSNGGADLSNNGRYVAFGSLDVALDLTGPAYRKVVRKDMWTGAVDLVSGPPSIAPTHVDTVSGPHGRPIVSGSSEPTISGDGWVVAFETDWTYLSRGPQGTYTDVVVHDFVSSDLELVSRAQAGGESDQQSQRPVLSADGMTVAFESLATNLVAVSPLLLLPSVYRAARTVDPLPVERNIGTGPTGDAAFNALLAGQTTDSIAFDDGLVDGQALDTRYAPQGVTFTGLSARATPTFTHSPPFGAQASGYNTPAFTGDFTIDVSPAAASIGLWTYDVEADIVVRVHRSDGRVISYPITRPNNEELFIGFTSNADDIVRLTFESPGDLFIIDDLVWGRQPPVNAPEVTITSPIDGASYTVGDPIVAAYACTDDQPGVACVGPVANGDRLDTSAPGQYSFTVTATDADGNVTTRTHSYAVLAPPDNEDPIIDIALPLDGATYIQGDPVDAGYACTDGLGSGIIRCQGTELTGEPIDTSRLGPHTFTVDAEDAAGNTATQTVTYTVANAGDVTPPQIWITRPLDGAALTQRDIVTAEYFCDDIAGAGVARCQGTMSTGASVASGRSVPTSVPGVYTLTVEAEDLDGNVSTSSVEYTVGVLPGDTVPPYLYASNPLVNARIALGAKVPVVFNCRDEATPASGVATCIPGAPYLDTSTLGRKAITGTTTDYAGNTRFASLPYEVIDDEDGDGLPALWETEGIDIDRNGTIDYVLPGANPLIPDIYVEMDYMTCTLSPDGCPDGFRTSQAPQPGAIDDVVASFAAAGIVLHLELDEPVPEVRPLRFLSRGPGALDDYEDLRSGPTTAACDGTFGTPGERARTDCPTLIRAKALVTRYGMWAHSFEFAGSSGIAEVVGNDFLITTGSNWQSWTNSAGTLRAAEAGTLMHELGHTLGLGHGGRIDAVQECGNWKPNYLSVMNYRFQVPNLDPTRPLDYSDTALPTLVESALDERAGVQGPSGRNVVYSSPAGTRVVPADGPIDWNANGVIDTTPVSVNIDGSGGCGTTIGGTLRGADDWENLAYLFYVSPDFAPGARTTAVDLIDQELDADDALTEAENTDFDGDGISNADDTCDTVPDATNRDVDQDQIGDACDDNSKATIAGVGNTGKVTMNQTIKLAILANPGFSPPTDVVRSTIRFGLTGTEVNGTDCTTTDVNRDGRSDLVCSYKLKGSRLQRGTSTAFVTARTTWGEPISGAIALTVG